MHSGNGGHEGVLQQHLANLVALEEEQRQEAARFAALEAENRPVALEEAQRQVAAREAPCLYTNSKSY